MKVLSVNIGKAEPMQNAKASGKTGIFKQPVQEQVFISKFGLKDDTICDTQNHGGPDQAVYIYGAKDYGWWTCLLGKDVKAGTFGENLTISELASDSFAIGDRLQVGEVLLEVTAPRIPCVTLATRMGDPEFVKKFKEAEKPGLYCRVITEGYVRKGDEVRLIPFTGERISAIEMFRDFYKAELSEQALRRYLAAPIAIRDRVDKEAKLQKRLN